MFRQPNHRSVSLAAVGLAGLLFASCGGSAEADKDAATVAKKQLSSTAATPVSNPAKPKPKGKGKRKAKAASFEFGQLRPPIAQAAPAGIELPESDPILGSVLVIEGEIIPHDVIRREVVRGPAGSAATQLEMLNVIITQEIARRVEQGASPGDFLISDKAVQDAIDINVEALKEQFPNGEVEIRHLLPVGIDGVAKQVHLTELFMLVFLPPGSVDDLPTTTLAAFDASEQGEIMLEALRSEREAEAAGEDLSGNFMFRQLITQTLREHLISSSDIELGNQLPVDVVMRVNGEDVLTATIWDRIKNYVSDVEVRQAKQWLANMILLERDLGADWLSEADAARKFDEHAEPYKDSMFSVENVALMVKKYPSVWVYKKFRRAYDSFQTKIRAELNPADLRAFADRRTKQLIGNALVDVDIILLSAYDFKEKRWIEDGWQKASDRSDEVFRQLAQEKTPWDEVLENFSDFYDLPTVAEAGQNIPSKSKGRFRSMTRNTLMQQIDESEYSQFLNGQTIVDFVFFGLNVGGISKPIRGPHGYYIVRLLRRQDAPTNSNLEDEQLIIMAEQDYTLLTLAEHCLKLRNESQVYGIE